MHLLMQILSVASPETASTILSTLHVAPGADFRWWGLFTCTLLHAGWIHLAGNMFFLWTFGPGTEDRYGRIGFLVFYLAGAAASSGAHALFESVPAIGASGAIAAVTGAFLVLYPFARVRCLWLFGLIIITPPAWWLIGLGVLWNLFAHGFGADRGVAHIAHLAGYAFGATLTMVLLWCHAFPRQPYDLFTFFRQAHRRRQLRALASEAEKIKVTRPERAATHPVDDEIDALAEARARVSTFIAERRLAEAADAYAEFAASFAHRPESLTLSRNAQYELATYLFTEARYAEAAQAFARFLDLYSTDREADQIRMLLARTYLNRLDRPDDARRLLAYLAEHCEDDDLRQSAAEELERISGSVSKE